MGRVKVDYTVKDTFKEYRKNKDERIALAYAQFSAIVSDMLALASDGILEGEGAWLPILGLFKVRKHKIRDYGRAPIDYQATKKLWAENPILKEQKQIVRHFNEHSDGYIYRVKWIKRSSRVKNKGMYKFSVVRSTDRTIAHKVIKERKSYA